MEAGSAHMSVTSPPYWGLRDYGLPPLEWGPVRYAPMAGLPEIEIPGCAEGCEHVWGEERVVTSSAQQDNGPGGGVWNAQTRGTDPSAKRTEYTASGGQYCQLCGGWRGCLGLERTPEEFVGHIVLVARALWRVLRDDGTWWLNFGDSYANHGVKDSSKVGGFTGARIRAGEGKGGYMDSQPRQIPSGLKQKDLIGIPWRVAFALQADGWYLRSDIIWAKGVSFCPTYSGSCMPESVRDRPTKGHEYVFLLSKNKRYFYDGDAVRENHSSIGRLAGREPNFAPHQWIPGNTFGNNNRAGGDGVGYNPAGRNLRSVWVVNPGNFPGSHFATFPPALVEPMIKAGTSARGCCSSCGAPWERVVEKTAEIDPSAKGSRFDKGKTGHNGEGRVQEGERYLNTTTGWAPTCSCGTEHPIPQEELDADPTLLDDFEIEPFEPVPCTVLDPFLGSGTTAEVAIRLGRRAVGIELSKDYCDEHIIPRLSKGIQMELNLCN